MIQISSLFLVADLPVVGAAPLWFSYTYISNQKGYGFSLLYSAPEGSLLWESVVFLDKILLLLYGAEV